MGTHVSHRDTVFTLEAAHFDAALAAVKACKDGPSYPIAGEDVRDASTLVEAFDRWAWQAILDDGGSIVDLRFEGQNANNDEILFAAIAPFVKDGSFIEMQYDDGGELFRYSFNNGEMRVLSPRIVWE